MVLLTFLFILSQLTPNEANLAVSLVQRQFRNVEVVDTIVMAVFEVTSLFHCTLACSRTTNCSSFTVEKGVNNKKCYLYDIQAKENKLVNNQFFDYYEMNDCYDNDSCLNGGTCINHSQICKCPPEYSGTKCENEIVAPLDVIATDDAPVTSEIIIATSEVLNTTSEVPVTTIRATVFEVSTTVSEIYTTTNETEITTVEVPLTTPVVQTTTVLEVPTTTVSEVPTTTVSEVPPTTVSEVPTTTVSELPTTTVSEAPTTTVTEVPTTTVLEVPTTTVSELPTTTVSELLTTTVTEFPTTAVTEIPTTTVSEELTTTTQLTTTTVTTIPTTTISQPTCDRTITILKNSPGSFSSDNYPAAYNINLNCTWLIDTTSVGQLNVTFNNIDLENTANCIGDKVIIYNGPNIFSTKMATNCGSSSGLNYITNINKAFIQFITDANDDPTHLGFKVSYAVVVPLG